MRALQSFLLLVTLLICGVFAKHGLSYARFGADAIPEAINAAQMQLYAGTPLGRYRELVAGPLAPLLIVHATTASILLLLAPIQLWLGVNQISKTAHKAVAVGYVVCGFVAALTGLLLSWGAWGGFATTAGFALYGVSWMFTTTRGLVHISQRDVDEHKEWMGRSVALALGGATIRVWLLGLLALSVPAEVAYPFAAWWGWIFNLILAEFVVRSTIGSTASSAYAR